MERDPVSAAPLQTAALKLEDTHNQVSSPGSDRGTLRVPVLMWLLTLVHTVSFTCAKDVSWRRASVRGAFGLGVYSSPKSVRCPGLCPEFLSTRDLASAALLQDRSCIAPILQV